jgi:hypothetical protein
MYNQTNGPKDTIVIFDTGNSVHNGAPITGDIRMNHIWLLRHVWPEGSNMIGIVDPEDIQPMSKKAELLKYLR